MSVSKRETEIGSRISKAVIYLGMNGLSLSKEFGCSPASVQYWLKGERQAPLTFLVWLEEKGINSRWVLTGEGEMLLGANESNVVQKYLEESLHAAKMEADRLREELKTAQASIPEGMGLEELEKFALSGVLRVIKNVSGASSGKFLAPKKVAEISVRAYRVCLEGRAKGLCQAEIIEQMDRIA